MGKIVIGLVGEKSGGKGTFKKMLEEIIGNSFKVKHVRFSDVLAETLKLWGIESNRENLQKLSPAMDQTYGTGTLTRAVQKRIENVDARVIILDGVRWPSDVEMLRQLPKNVLVYITAEARKRYEWSRGRKEKAGEENTTWEKFLEEELAETEKYIPLIGATADFKIENNGSENDFRMKVLNFWEIVVPLP